MVSMGASSCGGLVLVLLAVATLGTAQDLLSWEQLDALRDRLSRLLGSSGSPQALRRSRPPEALMPANKQRFQELVDAGQQFPCRREVARSPQRPTSVNRLRPGDVDVVAAMGDSLTSGNGIAATNILHVVIENKGMSWCIGGQSTWREFLTLPNILKELNPGLVGYAINDTWSHKRAAQFNVAEPAALSRDMLFQAKLLVRRIASDSRVDMHRDWKMVTVLIGNNDYCSLSCYYKNLSQIAEDHRTDLMAALDYFAANLPRTFVSLVPPPDVLPLLMEMRDSPRLCKLTTRVECTCLQSDKFRHRRLQFQAALKQFQRVQLEVASSSRYIKDDFAVVVQPFSMKLQFPIDSATGGVDYSYLSSDCFHLSQKSHAVAANALWNNLLEPVGAKKETWDPLFERFLCPSEDKPYIYTQANSST